MRRKLTCCIIQSLRHVSFDLFTSSLAVLASTVQRFLLAIFSFIKADDLFPTFGYDSESCEQLSLTAVIDFLFVSFASMGLRKLWNSRAF